MTGYHKQIQDATGCLDSEVEEIEDIMRHHVFHSTLDWQTKEQFDEGAVMAYEVFKISSVLRIVEAIPPCILFIDEQEEV